LQLYKDDGCDFSLHPRIAGFFQLYFYFLVHPERELTTNSNFQRVRFDYDDPLERKT
jgi:hypothetical protein